MSETTAGRHAPKELLRRYLEQDVTPAEAELLEQHLDRCAMCREVFPVNEEWMEESWEGILAVVLRPAPTLLERLLRACRVPSHLARLLAATPTLSRAWLTGLAAVLAFAVAAAHAIGSGKTALLPFLIAAPVLPLGGIAFAYGPRSDPAHELLAATPFSGPRLLLWRAAAVLGVALVPAALVTPLLPGPPLSGAVWLLPALSLTAACLAFSTRWPMPVAAGGTAALWIACVVLGELLATGQLVVFAPPLQAGYGVATAVLLLVGFLRRHHIDYRGGSSWSQQTRASA
ncbi:zf-HC2 domain-containing protein [Streptomyces sulphureus]|uniref:zf-HC2 domain-containing protein n=1 Tax=Streptomyces sulphureus TaxID=47758 RepID=UPI000381A0B3|nr:zf-HC2 domain-containing protein [Streptomyces sulphureus]